MAIGETNSHQSCAACKHQRRRCNPDCILAPHFPAEKFEEFIEVKDVFSLSNVTKMLRKLEDRYRGEAVKSMLWEASMWGKYPIEGPLGQYMKLKVENELLRQHCQQLTEMSSKKPHEVVPNINYIINPKRSEISQPHGNNLSSGFSVRQEMENLELFDSTGSSPSNIYGTNFLDIGTISQENTLFSCPVLQPKFSTNQLALPSSSNVQHSAGDLEAAMIQFQRGSHSQGIGGSNHGCCKGQGSSTSGSFDPRGGVLGQGGQQRVQNQAGNNFVGNFSTNEHVAVQSRLVSQIFAQRENDQRVQLGHNYYNFVQDVCQKNEVKPLDKSSNIGGE